MALLGSIQSVVRESAPRSEARAVLERNNSNA
jgi:hypothetical protein